MSWAAYLEGAGAGAVRDWRACPSLAPDTWRDAAGRPVAPPPTICVTDAGDPLRDEGLAAARSVLAAGCPDFLHVEGSASHTLTMQMCPAQRGKILAKWVALLGAS